MPEIKTLLFILVGLIFFVVRMWRKAQDAIRREAQERNLPSPDDTRTIRTRPVRPPGAPSFEEMLRQMQEQNQRGETVTVPTTASVPVPAPVTVRPEPRSLEAPKQPARSLEEPALKRKARSLEVPGALPGRLPMPARAAAAYSNSQQYATGPGGTRQAGVTTASATELAVRLRNVDEVRRALILAEVLQRRY